MDPSATPLSNSDFRALLATPRADRDAPATPSGFAKPSTPRGPKPDRGKTQSKTHKPAKSFKPKESTGEGEDDEDKDKYRDRAEERRRGVNPDYEGANQLAQVLSTGDVNIRNLSVEETKYLGGDIDHTHLVKGLDYALLQKERNRLEKEEEDSKAATAKKAGSTASASEKASDSTDGPIKRGDLKIRTGVARNVANTLFFPQKANVTEMYKPFRMAFVYEFDNEEEVFDTDVPTTLRRSKADCPNPPEAVFAGIDTAVLERIAKVMSYIKTTGGKKMRKKEREEMLAANGLGIGSGGRAADATLAPGTLGRHAAGQEPHTAGLTAAAAAADEEDDIFGDAGTDYKPSVSEKKKKALAAAKNAPSGPGLSFEEDMELGDGSEAPQGASLPPGVEPGSAAAYAAAAAAYAYPLPPPPSGAPGPAGGEYGAYGQQGYGYGDAGGAGAAAGGDGMSAAAKEAERWRVRASKTEEKEVDFEESAYAECYPMQAGFVAEVVDSDDEDRAQMDGGKVGKSRYDFETEEEWHQYKETREQAPKAAFQFGVKAGDGRKGGKEMSLEKSRDQKLSSQLGKIQKLMQDKGHDHTDAFAKEAGADTPSRGTPRRGAGGSTPRHTGEDPNLVMGGKRQRI